jgi:hypothetical protein
MASLALGFVGTVAGGLIGGPIGAQIGGMIGASLGGMLDNQLFPQKQQGPRLSDLSVQVSTYGQVIPKLYGPENRITGNVIYSGGLIETSHRQRQGGKGGGPSVSITTYTYSTNVAVALCDAQRRPIAGIVKVWANNKLVYSKAAESGSIVPDPVEAKVWSNFVVHDGSFTQLPDSLLEGALGIGNVPAYRGTAYVVIWGLQLADYGNRLPNLEFLVEADEEISCDEVLLDIAEACGIDPNTISASGITDPVRGYSINVASSGTGALQPLALAYNFDSASVAGGLRFISRGRGIAGIVPNYFLAGHQGGDQRPELIHWMRDAETNLPQQATIAFADPGRDYQVNAQVARRVAGSAQNNLSSQVPIVLDVPHGAQLADRMLWEVWNSRDTATFAADDRLIGITPGRVYLFTTPGGLEPLRIKTKQRGANGVINFEVLRDRAEVYQSTRQGVASPASAQTIDVPGPAELFLMDAPIFADGDDDTGFYFVVDGIGTGFRGADVVRSIDAGATYGEVLPVGRSSCIGVTDHLGPGPTELVDHVSVVRVTLDDPTDELTSCTLEAMLNGANACWVGGADGEDGEILQFMTATLIAAGVYDLRNLLRGRLGTEYAVDVHGTGDRFVLLDETAVYRADYGPADWNKLRSYKAVPLLTLAADASPQAFTNTGEGKRPLSPVLVTSETDPVTFDTSVAWFRRSRLRQPGLGNGLLPLGESVEAYEIDVIVAGLVVRTITAAVPSFEYTAAMRAADAGTGDSVAIAVYQLSDVRGRGRPAFAEI